METRKKITPRKFNLSMLDGGVFDIQIRQLHFYLPMPLSLFWIKGWVGGLVEIWKLFNLLISDCVNIGIRWNKYSDSNWYFYCTIKHHLYEYTED